MSDTTESRGCQVGCIGPFVALFLSIKTWGWTWWAILHFCLGWIYVAYWAVFRSGWIA